MKLLLPSGRGGSALIDFALSGALVLTSFFLIWQLLYQQTLENQSIFKELKQERLKMLESSDSRY